jgi:hypothetical protein
MLAALTLSGASLLLSLVSGTAPAKNAPARTPRLLLTIAAAPGPGYVRATIENVAAVRVALDVVPAFALRPSRPEDAGRPAFRAPIDTGTAKPLEVNGQERLELAPGEKRTLVVGLEPLYWDHYESVLWPSRPLRRVVIPGRYDLVLEVQDADSGHFWTSNVVAAVVKKAGSLEIEKPD